MATAILDVRSDDAVVRGDTIDGLAAIRAPSAALALWERRLPLPFLDALAALDLTALDDVTLTLDVPATIPALTATLVTAGYPVEAAGMLAIDIATLAAQHTKLSGASQVTARLQVVETDACRKFHADYVSVRSLCTYCGPATQWIRTDRPELIEDIASAAVAVFKGRLLLDEPTILHRSPPIAASGDRRLLLTVDHVRAD